MYPSTFNPIYVWTSKEMDAEKFICNKCSFTTNVIGKAEMFILKRFTLFIMCLIRSTRMPRSTPKTGFYTKETFDEIIDEMESRDPPVNIRIVISAIITKPSETKRKKKKPAKHSIEFMILDATDPSS